MRISFELGAALLAGTTLLAANGAWAATEQQNLDVSATVTNTCDVSATNSLSFGNVEPNSVTPTDADVAITITCAAAPTSASLTVGDGNNGGLKASPFDTARAMLKTGGINTTDADLLAYRLYKDSSHSNEISLSTGTTETITLTADTDMSTTIYGQVPASQTVDASNNVQYTDTVLLTLNYVP